MTRHAPACKDYVIRGHQQLVVSEWEVSYGFRLSSASQCYKTAEQHFHSY